MLDQMLAPFPTRFDQLVEGVNWREEGEDEWTPIESDED
jgi:hypothetical protein